MVIRNTFGKTERLALNNRIEILFASGMTISAYPVKIIWLPFQESMDFPVQILFTVSSKRFKKAVNRNRIKRQMKEIYRVEKKIFYDELREKNKQLLIGIIYIGNDVKPRMEILRNKIREGLEILIASSNNR
jgi:ribonuclease P protein component